MTQSLREPQFDSPGDCPGDPGSGAGSGMLQYLQSWFPGWGGWSGKPVEGLSAEQHEQWTPEEILGKAGSFPLAPWVAVKGDAGFIIICLLLLKQSIIFSSKQKEIEIGKTVCLIFIEAERGGFICNSVTKFEY